MRKVNKHFIISILLTYNFLFITASLNCVKLEDMIKHTFYPLRHCQRSNQSVVGYKMAANVEDCAEYSRLVQGLAFNFSPETRSKTNLFQKVLEEQESLKNISKFKPTRKVNQDIKDFYNCQALGCPETINLTTIVNDTRFDYYTLYAFPQPPNNSTCIPTIGVFILSEQRSNFSTATKVCRASLGNLAHILSYQRTNLISNLLRTKGGLNSTNIEDDNTLAYIGLNETTLNKFGTSMHEPLKCFQFRAWAAGHPFENRNPGCVAITTKNSWKVVNCNRKMLFICEILTSGPNPHFSRKQKCSVKRPNNRLYPKKNSLD